MKKSILFLCFAFTLFAACQKAEQTPDDTPNTNTPNTEKPDTDKPDTENPDTTPKVINLSENGCANTYIVNAAATEYSFNAKLKGNGIARTFTWTADGENITQGYSDADIRINPANAKLLWHCAPKGSDGWETRSPVVINSVTYNAEEGRISFKTPDTFINGNAIIAAYDASGNILWSWTIWALKDYDINAKTIPVGRHSLMDRNLGAIAGVESKDVSDYRVAAQAVGNYYQWGRKDPFPAITQHDRMAGQPWGLPAYTPIPELQETVSDYVNVILDESTYLATALGKTTYTVKEAIAEATKYPYRFLYNSTDKSVAPHHWTIGNLAGKTPKDLSEWRYLWGSVDGITSVKTIYDPCPPGWKVPTADVWMEVMEGVVISSGKNGIYSSRYGLYFPLAGQKKAGNSQFGGAYSVYLASATATSLWYPTRGDMASNSAKDVLKPTFYGEKVSHYDAYGSQGTQMRCVKETVGSKSQTPYTGSKSYNAILMGDSITEQWPNRGRKVFFSSNNYLCKGISGQTTMDMMARFTRDVLDNKPKVVVITAGTNDLAANDGVHVTSEDILNNVRLMAQVAEDYGAKVIIGSVCPSRDFWWKTEDQYKGDIIANRIVNHNKKLKAWAQSKGYPYADYHSALKDSQNNLKDAYCWDRGTAGLDHVHPNAAGYTVMEGVLKPLIDAALK
jgi:lysophospholipase L1-like esterase